MFILEEIIAAINFRRMITFVIDNYMLISAPFLIFSIFLLYFHNCYCSRLSKPNLDSAKNLSQDKIGKRYVGLGEKFMNMESEKSENFSGCESVVSDACSLLDDEMQFRGNRALMNTFVAVISQGIIVKLHNSKGSKDIKIFLQNNLIRWHSISPKSIIFGKRYKLFLDDIKRIEYGKKTSNFTKGTSLLTPDDFCFSIITDKTSLDVEVSSKVERDSLAQGFSALISSIKYHKNMV
jgi:hypothetical protein